MFRNRVKCKQQTERSTECHCSNGIAAVVRAHTRRIMGGKVQNSTVVCSQKMGSPQRAQCPPRYFWKFKRPNDYHAPDTTATRQRVGSNANKLPTHECSTCCSLFPPQRASASIEPTLATYVWVQNISNFSVKIQFVSSVCPYARSFNTKNNALNGRWFSKRCEQTTILITSAPTQVGISLSIMVASI